MELELARITSNSVRSMSRSGNASVNIGGANGGKTKPKSKMKKIATSKLLEGFHATAMSGGGEIEKDINDILNEDTNTPIDGQTQMDTHDSLSLISRSMSQGDQDSSRQWE